MRFIFLSVILFSIHYNTSAQHFLTLKTGKYTGYIQLCDFGNTCDSIAFSLLIQATPDPIRFNTKTVYFPKKNDPITKDYDLVLDTSFADFSHYLLDEKDGIILIETLQGNTLYSTYTVEGNLYTVRTSYFSDYIDYELVVYDQKAKQISTSNPDEENTVYTVETFPFITVQKGKLYKTN